MAYEQKDNSGSLFKNDRKERDTQPDYTGSAMVEGREFYLSGWLNEGQKGRKYQALKFKPKEEARRDTRDMEREADRNFDQRKPPEPDVDDLW